ncbi:MAG TPA: hypothetical protein VHV78_13485, partial [Gemmatimonadaceae bacterium]|nr:hypothetical protein [Gemmatimonadaceae bacterium]
MHRSAIATAASFVVAFGFVTSVGAQSVRSASFVANCSLSGDADRVFCETRTVALAPSANLRIDGRQNGGITVHAWDNSQFQVVAMVQAHSDTPADAQAIAGGINVTANDGEIRADGPSTNGNRESWSVSYEVWAPRHTALSLVAMNGGISVDGMDAAMTM